MKRSIYSLALLQIRYLMTIQIVLQRLSVSHQKDSCVHTAQNPYWLSLEAEILTAPGGQYHIGIWQMESVCSIKWNIKCKGFKQLWPWASHLTLWVSVYTFVKWGLCCSDGSHPILPTEHLLFISFYIHATQWGSYQYYHHFINGGKEINLVTD